MSTDIEQRLRDAHPVSAQYANGSRILLDAAEEIARLREALGCLLPGLILDLRYADDDDDKDALRSRIETVSEALARLPDNQ